MMKERTLRVLEFTKIRDMLTEKALTDLGAEKCQALVPSTNFQEVTAWQEETEEALALEAVLDPVEEKPEKPERKERPAEKRTQREANSGERREQPPKEREKRPPQQGGKGSERRERPPKREGRPPRGQGEHAKQAGEGRPPRQERSGNERPGGAPRGAGRAERAPRNNQQREHRAAESPKVPAAEHAPSAQAGAVQPPETSE